MNQSSRQALALQKEKPLSELLLQLHVCGDASVNTPAALPVIYSTAHATAGVSYAIGVCASALCDVCRTIKSPNKMHFCPRRWAAHDCITALICTNTEGLISLSYPLYRQGNSRLKEIKLLPSTYRRL